jgi:triosephosphate isomerase
MAGVFASQVTMRTPFVAGNWKMNTDRQTGLALARAIADAAPDGVDVGIAPPLVYLPLIQEAVGEALFLGAQNAYCEPTGAFTGEISVGMLKDVGCDFVLVGHSERRHIFMEATDLLARKASAVYNAGLILLHCVGETLAEREAETTFSVIEQQLAELSPKMDDPSRLVIAYEPVWAIGTGRNATDEQAQEVHAYIRSELAEEWNPEFAAAVRIVYGGSVKPENARAILGQPDVDGCLVGGASLKAESFLSIVNAAQASET